MTNRRNLPRLAAVLTAIALVGAACGSADESPTADGSVPAAEEPVTTTVTTTIASDAGDDPGDGDGDGDDDGGDSGGGGWIDGEPEWRAGGVGDGEAGRELAETSGAVDEGGFADDSDVAASEPAASKAEAPIPVEPDGGIGDGAEPIAVDDELPVDDTPLRAGSVDDNADFEGFLAYLDRIAGLGIATRDLDPTGRTIVTVVDEAGNPAPGVVVEASSATLTPDGVPITVRTTADGTVRFHPGFYGDVGDGVEFRLASSDTAAVSVAAGDDVTLTAPATTVAAPVPLDVLFLLDATGSMGDEIDRLKQTIDIVAERVAALDPAPDVRFAMTLYRDEGDQFVTANYDFTADIAVFRTALADVVADGGGDYPEALDEGLADALAKPAWRDAADAVQLVFVVADAPPQVSRQVATPYTDSVRTAIERGIKIFPVASSESDDQAEAVFRQMAQATGAPFVFLSNGAAGASTGASTDIASTDYEELALDELVVRLIAEELSALRRGDAVAVPTTVAPDTTNPDGQ